MLSRWLNRGLGQVLAPDPKHAQKQGEGGAEEEFNGGLWNIVAPDPQFYKKEESNVAQSPALAQGNTSAVTTPPHAMTPSKENAANSAFATPNSKLISTAANTPSFTNKTRINNETNDDDNNKEVEALVLSAAKGLASAMNSPTPVWDDTSKFFSFCASSTPLKPKALKRVTRMLNKDPLLAEARASKMGVLVPDGFTPLHTTAYVGNYDVALILIDFQITATTTTTTETGNNNKNTPPTPTTITNTYHPVSLDTRDLQGRTALHIASSQGHIKLVKLLKQKMTERDPSNIPPVGIDAPTDLTGRTPMGWVETSKESKARINRQELRKELFSPGDKSVYGRKTPALDRTGGSRVKLKLSSTASLLPDVVMKDDRNSSSVGDNGDESAKTSTVLDLVYGFADMPGMRIDMEDAICHSYPLSLPSKNNGKMGFFGVFDGHGDGGIASRYIAENIISCLTTSLDEERKKSNNNDADSDDTDVLTTSFTNACVDIDVDLKAMTNNSSGRNGGTTGIMSLITPDKLIIGNVGDSRCILVQKPSPPQQQGEEEGVVNGIANLNLSTETEMSSMMGTNVDVTPLSIDHNPNLPDEKQRIEQAGLEVIAETFKDECTNEMMTIWKIQKSERDKVAVSRAFGDFDYKTNDELPATKQAIVPTPEIQIHKRDPARDMYLVLACDGVWDVMSNDEVGQFVAEMGNVLMNEPEMELSTAPAFLPEVGDELLKKCLDLGSTDNMSVLIVAFPSAFGDGIEVQDDNDDAVVETTTRVLDFTEEE